jgi:hypothetical protein
MYSCELNVDLSNNQTLTATVSSLRGEEGCLTAVPTYGPVGDWTWQLEPSQTYAGGQFFHGQYAATRGSCNAGVEISVRADSTPFAVPVVGQAPHAVLSRTFTADSTNPACPQVPTAFVNDAGLMSCTGFFEVSAKKI